MFPLILIMLSVDTVLLAYYAGQCADWQWENLRFLMPMYLVQLVAYAALYYIYMKMRGGKREKLSSKLEQLRKENEELKRLYQEKCARQEQ